MFNMSDLRYQPVGRYHRLEGAFMNQRVQFYLAGMALHNVRRVAFVSQRGAPPCKGLSLWQQGWHQALVGWEPTSDRGALFRDIVPSKHIVSNGAKTSSPSISGISRLLMVRNFAKCQ